VLSAAATISGRGEVYFETVAMVLVLVTLGRYLEGRARAGSTAALSGLLAGAPAECTIVRDGADVKTRADAVRVGDLVRVFPGDSMCVDGIVVTGEAGVDESMLTGESRAVFKSAGDSVFAGTVDRDGCLLVRAAEVGERRVVAGIERLLCEARASRAPIERLADRISRCALPVILATALASLGYWTVVGGVGRGLMVMLSVLLIACPCALGIATPMALWLALGRAARNGIVVRRAEILERLAAVRAAAFDKTGTLTGRELSVSAIVSARPSGERDLLRIAASLESGSEHPVGRSIRAHAAAGAVELERVEGFRALPGLGVQGRLASGEAALGSRLLMERLGAAIAEEIAEQADTVEASGRTLVFCAWGAPLRCAGFLALTESPREEAPAALERLKGLGVAVSLLTGDRTEPARALGGRLGIEASAGLLPAAKAGELERIRRRSGAVLFVGDGLNDAPAMKSADVGFALGCGSDLTREAADVAILGDDLRKVPWLLELARRTYRTIGVNLFWAFGYNAAGVALAAAGKLNPLWAAAAMVSSSFFVVRNSMRLSR
jgi:heavy metal translocating P-type ATPase